MKSPEGPTDDIEEKVEELADKMAELALLMKRGQMKAVQDLDRRCSFCGKTSHGTNRSEDKPNCLVHCGRCGKMGHTIETSWCREVGSKAKGVGISGARSESGAEAKLANTKEEKGEEKREIDQVALECNSSTEEVVWATQHELKIEPLPNLVRRESRLPISQLLMRNTVGQSTRTPSKVLKKNAVRRKRKKNDKNKGRLL